MSDVAVSLPSMDRSRRHSLRNQRKWRFWQSIWRFTLLLGLSGGLGWGLSHPHWLIRSADQIKIEGNDWVSDPKIEQMLKLSYPQTLWRFPSQTIREQLQQQPPLADAELSRSLFPSEIIVRVEERQPIAIAYSQGQKGFLDAEGVFIPQSFYKTNDKRLKLPLTVLGYLPQFQTIWQTFYPLLQQSTIKIQSLDWRNPNNLILHTELGQVYLGANHSLFSQQLKVLSQMTGLSSQITKDRLIYIDVSNPNQPTIQLKHQSPQPIVKKDVKNP